MNNKNRLFRVTSLLLVLCFVSTVMISGTFAKYTNEYAGSDTALVARWSFTGEFNDAAFVADLPIWTHTYTTNIYEKEGSDYLIAPGIQGAFKVEFAYDADVDADLTFEFAKSGITGRDASNKVPIQYSLDNFTNIYYDLNALEDAIIATATNKAKISGSGGTYVVKDTSDGNTVSVNQTVSWRWPYDVSAHNALTNATTGVAADRAAANFLGTGDLIEYPAGTETAFKEWTDVDDTLIGNSFSGLTRDSYILTLTIAATQKTPTP